ncbi:hypothetical protein [Actinoplanes sp. NBRC 103695]|uniref:hypothetical protein n=1 Tax=Actinoplanes sp. NBRC 103695 TaxID=3032202 RepID=UPI0024A4559F|nr:hypothetical protein [Actinoplanes sp. NBRC 103695]GLY94293.1 hypothetical protein Acsp02_15490 [Actinoplanes sp. NBRC 103695]
MVKRRPVPLYGLTEVDLGLGEPPSERADELDAARWALAALDSAEGRAPFDEGLTPAYGVFYRGWTNWLRGGVLALRLHDKLFTPRYAATAGRWLSAAQQRLDPQTGLLPHRADVVTGAPLEVARGHLAEHDPAVPGGHRPGVRRATVPGVP